MVVEPRRRASPRPGGPLARRDRTERYATHVGAWATGCDHLGVDAEEPQEADDEDVTADELEAGADALASAANDLVESGPLARLAGLDMSAWLDQVRVTEAARSLLAQHAEQVRRLADAALEPQRESLKVFQAAIAGSLCGSVGTDVFANLADARPIAGYVAAALEPMSRWKIDLGSQFQRIVETLRSHHPRNWPDLDDESIPVGHIGKFVKDTRWPIVWVPEASVVAALVHAAPTDRDQVLLDHEATVLGNCDDALDECSGTVILELVPYAKEAVLVARDGHRRVAQAQAAAVITTIVEVHLEFANLGDARRSQDLDMDEIAFDRARLGYILSCIPRSLTNFGDRGGGAPLPDYFNRHATLHHVCDVQYTPVNALVSLMLMTALLRELDEYDRKGLWEALFTEDEDRQIGAPGGN